MNLKLIIINYTNKIDSMSFKSSTSSNSSTSTSSFKPSTKGKSLASFDISFGTLGNSFPSLIFFKISSLFDSHGGLPVNISSTTHPSAQISQGASCTLSLTASGDKYIGVPLQYGSNFLFLLCFSLFANPKSPIFALNSVPPPPFLPLGRSKMFSGFKSQ
ncbi:hypothetical protein ACJIZ3_010197 [Penstemon smallii]|uniref:Uncharacterized protein n=1 Tax=Penstemon smallii TaxID=265156 RepID=A0ABD3TEN0_9LAMI